MIRAAMLAAALVAGYMLGRTSTRRAPGPASPPDPMAQPFLDSRNSATYLYNARTGVVTSYN